MTRPRSRPAELRDCEVVAALLNAINSLEGETPVVPMTAAIVARDLLGPAPRAILLVAELDAVVVGFATAGSIYDAARTADILMLLDLYVAPESRRRGVARALMAGMASLARDRGAPCLWWGVDEGDDAALAFYRAIGARGEGMFSGEILEGAALSRLAAS